MVKFRTFTIGHATTSSSRHTLAILRTVRSFNTALNSCSGRLYCRCPPISLSVAEDVSLFLFSASASLQYADWSRFFSSFATSRLYAAWSFPLVADSRLALTSLVKYP